MKFRNTPEGREAQHTQYGELALEARSAAAAETLENVREKYLRAAATWEHLANSGRRIERLRERRAIEQLAAPTAQPGGPAKPASCG